MAKAALTRMFPQEMSKEGPLTEPKKVTVAFDIDWIPLPLAPPSQTGLRPADYIGSGPNIPFQPIDSTNPYETIHLLDKNLVATALDVDGMGSTPLGYLMRDFRGDPLPAATYLLSHGAKLVPPHFAVVTDNEDALRFLLDHGAGVDTLSVCPSSSFSDRVSMSGEFTALFLAAYKNHVACAKVLLENGADPNAVDSFGDTPLSVAHNAGNAEVAQNDAVYVAESPMSVAIGKLHEAASRGQTKLVWTLLFLSFGLNRNRRGYDDCTPLHIASHNGHSGCVLALLKAGADVNALNKAEATPLWYACKAGNIEVAKILLDHGARADIEPIFKSTYPLLHVAVQSGKIELVKLLVDAGASVHAKTIVSEETALHIALKEGKADAAIVLLEAGADPNVRNFEWQTPLQLLAINFDWGPEVAELFARMKDRGLDLYARDYYLSSRTVFDYAGPELLEQLLIVQKEQQQENVEKVRGKV
ncbi:hypothetical protein HDU96_002175 [Phlyctochytrium bullatum]|nr:hypothetical protein HDU96_002175 [Phlyctochytrium bullatum]